ncbi:MAG: hypothetical protein ACD_87C00230G0003, partial [uncultured bacterium]
MKGACRSADLFIENFLLSKILFQLQIGHQIPGRVGILPGLFDDDIDLGRYIFLDLLLVFVDGGFRKRSRPFDG